MQKSDFSFFYPFRVRYSEIDAQGVVFNAHYLTYFDTAITEFTKHIGFNYAGEAARTGCDFHLVKSIVEYKIPIFFDRDIQVYVRPGRIGNTSIIWDLAIFEEGKDDLLSTGEVIWVYTNLDTHRPLPLPDTLLSRL